MPRCGGLGPGWGRVEASVLLGASSGVVLLLLVPLPLPLLPLPLPLLPPSEHRTRAAVGVIKHRKIAADLSLICCLLRRIEAALSCARYPVDAHDLLPNSRVLRTGPLAQQHPRSLSPCLRRNRHYRDMTLPRVPTWRPA